MILILKTITQQYWPEFLAGVILLILLCLGLPYYEIDPITEFFNLQAAKESISGQNPLGVFPFQVNYHQFLSLNPLWPWLTMGIFKVTGLSFMASRGFAAFCSASAAVAGSILGARLFDNKQAALYSLALLACSLGFGYWGVLSTPEALNALLYALFFHGIVSWVHHARKRLKEPQVLKNWAIFLGVILGLQYLLAGTVAVVLTAILGSLLGWLLGRQRSSMPLLMPLPFFQVSIAFFSIVITWGILAGLLTHNPGFLVNAAFIWPSEQFLGLGFWHKLPHDWFFYLKRLFFDFLPLFIFIPAAFFESFPQLRRGQHSVNEPVFQRWLLLWFLLGFITYSLSCYQPSTAMLPFMLPLAMLSGHYLAKITTVNFNDAIPAYDNTVLFITVLFLLLPVFLTIVFFHVIPTDFVTAFWPFQTLPFVQDPILHAISIGGYSIPLNEAFPTWKLLLTPGPFLLLIGCLVLGIFQSDRRNDKTPSVILGTLLAFILFFKLVYLPVFARPVAQHLIESIDQYSQHQYNHHAFQNVKYSPVKPLIDKSARDNQTMETQSTPYQVALMGQSTMIKQLLFLLPALTPAKITLSVDDFVNRVESARTPIFGIIADNTYYTKVSADHRAGNQLVAFNWYWDLAKAREIQKLFTLKQPQFNVMQGDVLVFSRRPQSKISQVNDFSGTE
ncbi:MAG: hypothetical protein AAGI66_07995 [Cyanobacteria bacterium P01_H01_bin.74]